jgi:hypothetical protein
VIKVRTKKTITPRDGVGYWIREAGVWAILLEHVKGAAVLVPDDRLHKDYHVFEVEFPRLPEGMKT